MIQMWGEFRLPSPVVADLAEGRSRYHIRDGLEEVDLNVCVRKPRLSNSDEDSEEEVDYDRTPVQSRKTNVAPIRTAPTRAA